MPVLSCLDSKNPSNSGVQHGDPWGPLLFALGLEAAISEGRTEAEIASNPLDLTGFFLNNGTMAQRGGLKLNRLYASTSQPKPSTRLKPQQDKMLRPPGRCCRPSLCKIQGKLGRAEKLMTQLVHRSYLSSFLLRLVPAQQSCPHDAPFLSPSPLPFTPPSFPLTPPPSHRPPACTSFKKCLGKSSKCPSLEVLGSEHRPPSRKAVPVLETQFSTLQQLSSPRAAAHPPFATAFALSSKTHDPDVTNRS